MKFIIGAYLEGAKDSRRLFGLIREISKSKPMVIWKGGRTPAGAQAAVYHSSSLAGSDIIWKAAMKQSGVAKVESHEELVDTILAFLHLPRFEGNSVAVIAGLYGAGGGASVASSDAFTSEGMEVPPLSPMRQEPNLRPLFRKQAASCEIPWIWVQSVALWRYLARRLNWC